MLQVNFSEKKKKTITFVLTCIIFILIRNDRYMKYIPLFSSPLSITDISINPSTIGI